MENKCCKKVYPKSPYGFVHGYPCGKNASIERDGKFYCRMHDPEAVALRKKQSEERYKIKMENLKELEKSRGDALLREENLKLWFALLDFSAGERPQIIMDVPDEIRRQWWEKYKKNNS